MEHERDARERRDRVAGDVVLGRAQTAADEHDVGAGGGEPERLDDPVEVVADRLVVRDVHAGGGELFGHPPRVRIGDLPEQQLGADRDDLGPHGVATR